TPCGGGRGGSPRFDSFERTTSGGRGSHLLAGDPALHVTGGDMFFRDDEIEQLRKGVWEADCYRMTLTQNESEMPARFAGQGYLRQKGDGTIHYQIYPSEVK